MSATVVIATSSALMEKGLMGMLGSIGRIEYRGSADDAQSTGRLIADQAPDVLIVDQDIAETLVKGTDISPWPRLLVLSRRSHIGTDITFKPGGVCGAIHERATAHTIEHALRTISDCKSSSNETECRGCPLRKSMALPQLPLTDREYAVFKQIGLGLSNQQIALAAGRSVKTIESHRESIKRKLGLKSGAGLAEAAFAWKRGDYSSDRHTSDLARCS